MQLFGIAALTVFVAVFSATAPSSTDAYHSLRSGVNVCGYVDKDYGCNACYVSCSYRRDNACTDLKTEYKATTCNSAGNLCSKACKSDPCCTD